MIKTWREKRKADGSNQLFNDKQYMQAEIDELRAALQERDTEILHCKLLAEVGAAMVSMTTTVYGQDEWEAIPMLWKICMDERDTYKTELAAQRKVLEQAQEALKNIPTSDSDCDEQTQLEDDAIQEAITAIEEQLK